MSAADCPSVVIVLVSWNGLEDTLACLASLQRLTYPNCRTVLVDNGSRDRTVEVVRRYFPHVSIIANRSNSGYVHANNQGVAWGLEQGADWILLLNNDVVVEPGLVGEMVRVGETVPNVGIVGPVMQRTLRPDILDLGGDLDFCFGQVVLRRYQQNLNGRKWLPIDYVWGCALMARRAVWERLGGLDPVYDAYFEDGDLCLRAKTLGYRTVVALETRIQHQVGRSGERRFAWQTYHRLRNHVLFFTRFAKRRHWPTLIPGLLLFQLPFVLAQSTRAYLVRKIRRGKYARRPVTLWGYERRLVPPDDAQIARWLDEAGYTAR